MQLNNLTVRAQEAIMSAHKLADRRKHPEITPLHLLAALVADETGIVRPLVEKVGGNRRQIEQLIEAELSRQPEQSGQVAVDAPRDAPRSVSVDTRPGRRSARWRPTRFTRQSLKASTPPAAAKDS